MFFGVKDKESAHFLFSQLLSNNTKLLMAKTIHPQVTSHKFAFALDNEKTNALMHFV